MNDDILRNDISHNDAYTMTYYMMNCSMVYHLFDGTFSSSFDGP